MLSKKYSLVCCVFLMMPKISKGMESSAQLQGAFALGCVIATAGVTKFIKKNETIKTHGPRWGLPSGEIATVTGLMGGFFSLANTVPGAARYGWLVPVLYGCYKIGKNRSLNAIVGCTPEIGEPIAGPDIRKTRTILNDPRGEIYEDGAKDNHMYEVEKDEQRYEGPNYDNVQKTLFATVAITAFLYEPIKFILKKSFDYPDCLVNWGGRAVNGAVNLILNR